MIVRLKRDLTLPLAKKGKTFWVSAISADACEVLEEKEE